MEQPLVNRVAQSNLTSINLEQFLPKNETFAFIDIKDFLFKELILKEKEFRNALQQKNWEAYNNKYVSIFCSNDAIIPQWASMLACTYLQNIAKKVFFKNPNELTAHLTLLAIENHNYEQYLDKPIIIKGCGSKVTEEAYLTITQKLQPVAKSIMYGEACSTVPIFKKKKTS